MMDFIRKLFCVVDSSADEKLREEAELDNMLHDFTEQSNRSLAATQSARAVNGRLRASVARIRAPFADFEHLMTGGGKADGRPH